MKLVFLDETQIGAVLAKTIYGPDGSVLLTKGIALNNKYISLPWERITVLYSFLFLRSM